MLYILGTSIVFGLGFLAGRMDRSLRRLEKPVLTAPDIAHICGIGRGEIANLRKAGII